MTSGADAVFQLDKAVVHIPLRDNQIQRYRELVDKMVCDLAPLFQTTEDFVFFLKIVRIQKGQQRRIDPGQLVLLGFYFRLRRL